MKFLITSFLFSITITIVSAQESFIDSLQRQLNRSENEDTSRVIALFALADYYSFFKIDSCQFYTTQVSQLSQKLNYTYGKFLAHFSNFHILNSQANYPMALEAAQNMLNTAELIKQARPLTLGFAYYCLGLLYREMDDNQNAISKFQQGIQVLDRNGISLSELFAAFSQLGVIYSRKNMPDTALWYAQKGYDLGLKCKDWQQYFSLAFGVLGNIHLSLHHYDTARELFRSGILQSKLYNNIYFQAINNYNLANLFDKTNREDSCIYFAMISLHLCQEYNFGEIKSNVSKILSKIYESENKPDSALKYLKIMVASKDSVFSQSKGRQFLQNAFNELLRLKEISSARERYQSEVRFYALLAALGVFLLVAFLFYRNSRQKQKANKKIEKAYAELKSTQAQLIQSEKMASLGELTAGIAHEIQNPLNFVNNFSEVNTELIDEMQNELLSGNEEEAISISKDIKDNQEKINLHGKRADAIIKSMLQHSQISAGHKELTDINGLAEEYLRLSYHGLRAKDKSFNTTIHSHFDQSIQKINIVPQDLGRMLVNLYNNAFYAVSEKKKQCPEGYEPAVTISTKRVDDKVEIRIKDNGMGIPIKVMDKIFQPFFTTKPSGQGTGLGLSLSYDIITKEHGGTISVKTQEGDFAEFIIQLPLK